jgi:hypothetical protein
VSAGSVSPVTRTEPRTADGGRAERARADGVRALTLSRVAALLAPAAIFLAIRGAGLIVLALMAAANNTTVGSSLTAWDGQWFLGIAQGGYTDVPLGLVDAHGIRDATTPYAFFPGYPYLVKWVAALPGVGLTSAGIALSLLFGVLASYALVRIGAKVSQPEHARRTGLLLVGLFAAAPMAITLSMTYSEAMFCALAAWGLVGVLERQWWLAGVATLAAGLVRPTAAALVLAVGLAALVAVVKRRDGARPWLAGLLAPAGLLGYLAVVAGMTGQAGGWFALQQRGWNSSFDGGTSTAQFTLEALTGSREALLVITACILLCSIVLVGVSIRMRLPGAVLVSGVAVLLMDLGSNGLMNSKARLLLPAFTLLIPLAIGLARRRPATAVLWVTAAALFSAWFGGYALTVWPYAI